MCRDDWIQRLENNFSLQPGSALVPPASQLSGSLFPFLSSRELTYLMLQGESKAWLENISSLSFLALGRIGLD